jgi:hypothetical protein
VLETGGLSVVTGSTLGGKISSRKEGLAFCPVASFRQKSTPAGGAVEQDRETWAGFACGVSKS